jgi:hypothetical protein
LTAPEKTHSAKGHGIRLGPALCKSVYILHLFLIAPAGDDRPGPRHGISLGPAVAPAGRGRSARAKASDWRLRSLQRGRPTVARATPSAELPPWRVRQLQNGHLAARAGHVGTSPRWGGRIAAAGR